jgi:hypothetical protein
MNPYNLLDVSMSSNDIISATSSNVLYKTFEVSAKDINNPFDDLIECDSKMFEVSYI